MPPVLDHEVHEKVKIAADEPYGCSNRGKFATGYFAPDRVYKPDGTFYIIQRRIPHAMSTACRNFYLWDKDPRCSACKAERDTEYAKQMGAL